MVVLTFSVSEWKYPFWANLVQKISIISLSWNLVPTLVRICRIQWRCSLFLFLSGNTLFRKIWSKNQYHQLKLKFGTLTNSNMQNSVVMFIFFVFDRAYAFWANLVQKLKIVSSRWNSRLKLTQICRIQWWCSLFLFLTRNIPFGEIWSKKSKLSV